MEKRTFYLNGQGRQSAADFCRIAPEGWRVQFSEPVKKREQEEKYHSMICEIADQTTFLDRKWNADDMKRLLVDDFAEEMRLAGTPLHHDSRVTPSFDGKRIVQLGIQTREFYVKEAAAFIEYLYAFGSERGVVFKK